MKNIFFSGTVIRTLLVRFFLILFFLGVFAVSAVASVPYAGSLYDKWMQKIFVELPSGETAFTQELTIPTVQRAHALADSDGKELAWATRGINGQKQLLIGEKFVSSDTVKISGDDATLAVHAESGNPEISLGETDGSHGSIYFDTPSEEMRIWTGKKENGSLIGQNSFSLSDSGIEFSHGLTANNNPVVGAFACAENSGFLIGFDENADPICSTQNAAAAWISTPLAAQCSAPCGGGTMTYKVECRSGSDYSTIEDNLVCEGLPDPKPSSSRACNVLACE